MAQTSHPHAQALDKADEAGNKEKEKEMTTEEKAEREERRKRRELIQAEREERRKLKQERKRKRLEVIQYVKSLPEVPKHSLPPAPFCETCDESFWCEHNLERVTKKDNEQPLTFKQENLIFGE